MVSTDELELTRGQMLGGGHVRRRSLESSFEASPCMLAEKHIAHHALPSRRVHVNHSIESEHQCSIEASFDKSRIFDNSFNRSAGSGHFGDLCMNLAKQGLLSR